MRIVESGSPIGILIELPRIKCTKHRGQAITITQLASIDLHKAIGLSYSSHCFHYSRPTMY